MLALAHDLGANPVALRGTSSGLQPLLPRTGPTQSTEQLQPCCALAGQPGTLPSLGNGQGTHKRKLDLQGPKKTAGGCIRPRAQTGW